MNSIEQIKTQAETLTVYDLTFELRRSSKRKSIGIIIDRRGELILAAPQDCPREQVQRTAEERYRWIYTRLAKKEMLFRPPRPKQFMSGESFSYLGYLYRLQVLPVQKYDEDTPPLHLSGEWFLLRADERERGAQHFIEWYNTRGKLWLEPRVALLARHLGVTPRGITIRDLGYRWGSCGKLDMLHFHWRVVQLPPPIIDYIIVHELAHLEEPRHNAAFWRLVQRIQPEFATYKQWLAEQGSQYCQF